MIRIKLANTKAKLSKINPTFIIQELVVLVVSIVIWIVTSVYVSGLWQTCNDVQVLYKCKVGVQCPSAGLQSECFGAIPHTNLNRVVFIISVFIAINIIFLLLKNFVLKRISSKLLFYIGLLVMLIGVLIFFARLLPPTQSQIQMKSIGSDSIAEIFLGDNGCEYTGKYWNCRNSKIEIDYGCNIVTKEENKYASSLLVSLYKCESYNTSTSDKALYFTGCSIPSSVNYLLFNTNSFIKLSTLDGLAGLFGGTIDSADSAVLFAKLATGAEIWDRVEVPTESTMQVVLDTINSTRAVAYEDGYKVNLFAYQACGCGNHSYSELIYTLSRTGKLKLESSRELFSPPGGEGMCVD